MNWVDLVIILVLIFFIQQGFVNGFWSILIDFLAFFGALLISLKSYKVASAVLQSKFLFTFSLANALGYLAIAVISEILISFILIYLIKKLPPKILKNKINRILGLILSLGQGVLFIAFALLLVISLPINPAIKTDISSSAIGGFILNKTTGIEKNINDSLTYMTIEPTSHESISLDDQTQNLTVDAVSQNKMFQLMNKERTNRGIAALTWDTKLLVVAQDYAKMMWSNKYFGHYDPSGRDVGDRLTAAGISYEIAGENLALAPTVEIAHTGLMNSVGHRANILDIRFYKVGVGVIDNGYYGKMFVQVFTN